MNHAVNEILVPVDGSENSVRATRFALRLASAMQVGLRLFYVFPAASVELVGMAGMSRGDIENAAEAAGERAFEKVRKEIADPRLEGMERDIALGDPAEEIIAQTERNAGLLVVIGRRGLSRMKSLLLGSVSDKVIRHAACPVTVVT